MVETCGGSTGESVVKRAGRSFVFLEEAGIAAAILSSTALAIYLVCRILTMRGRTARVVTMMLIALAFVIVILPHALHAAEGAKAGIQASAAVPMR